MKLVACVIAQSIGAPAKFCLKDEHSGIVYPNLLTAEQINSPVVHGAATTYIKMKQSEQIQLHLTSASPLLMGVFDFIGWPGCRTGRTSASGPAPEQALPASERKLLLDKIEQLKRTIVHLEDRNERQARIIRAVQGAVRGDVQ